MLREEVRELLVDRPVPGPNWSFTPEELAAVALMTECAYVDGHFVEEEREAICDAVQEEFMLDQEAAEWLVVAAEICEDEVWVDWPFIETVERQFNKDEKLAVIRRLWEVALADGSVHPFEERLIARIARGLGILEEAVAAIRKKSSERMGSREADSRG